MSSEVELNKVSSIQLIFRLLDFDLSIITPPYVLSSLNFKQSRYTLKLGGPKYCVNSISYKIARIN